MPSTRYISLNINSQNVDLPNVEETDLGFKLSYILEEPENFTSKQGAEPQNITLPASKINDQIFNTFHNPQVEDLTPDYNAIKASSIVLAFDGGSGWTVGDFFIINGFGTVPAVGTVLTTSGGACTSYTLLSLGNGYSLGITTATALSGTGINMAPTITALYTSSSPREYMPCVLSINGSIPVLNGYALLTDATFTDKPESYDITLYGSSGQWVIDLQNITMWDCVNPNNHEFTVAVVEASWANFNTAGDGSDDYVYAPVRYRQPFDGTTLGYQGDNCVNIYHLRPSISLYWLLYRAFQQIGYTISSQFFTTAYFQSLVLPWVWGDFYDLNSQLVQGVTFKAVGELPTELPPTTVSTIPFWSGNGSGSIVGTAGGSAWWYYHSGGGWDPGLWTPNTLAIIGNGIMYDTVIGTTSIANPGLGYSVGETFTITPVGAWILPILNTGTILTVGGSGEVLTYSITSIAGTRGYAGGNICNTVASGAGAGFTLLILTNTSFSPASTNPSNHGYIFNNSGTSGAGKDRFMLDIKTPPDGYDNFNLYSFDESTGTMIYSFNPPSSLATPFANVSATFVISVLCVLTMTTGAGGLVGLECLHTPLDPTLPTVLTCQSIMPSGGQAGSGGTTYPDSSGYPSTITACNFTVAKLNPGDILRFRLVALADYASLGVTFGVFSGGYLNNSPAVLNVPTYTYNPVTEQYGFFTPNSIWSPLQSSLNMTGFLIQLGNAVNLKNYDAFRNYQILDLIGGVIDMFNMELSTDAINQVVYMEPMFGSTLPTAETCNGYFDTVKLFDWSGKRDYTKASKMSLFNGIERQVDLGFKLDSSDGAQNIWAQRCKNIYLADRTWTGGLNLNNFNRIDPGIIAGVPGCARYMFPNRMAIGNRQMTNRFFSAVMHVTFPQWLNVQGTASPAPQLITIFSDSANSSEAISQTFTPKLAFYGGRRSVGTTGGWIWIGDPASPYLKTGSGNSSSRKLPFMAAVNYGTGGTSDPVLSYSDELNGSTIMSGLLTQFYRQRFAIMRNGQLLTSNIRLNLNDVTNWAHKECIMIDGTLYALIQIDGYDPLQDNSTPCTFWKVVLPEEVDVANTYPSKTSIANYKSLTSLPNSYDLRYAPLLLYATDTPQIG